MFAPEEKRRWPLRSKAIVAGMPLGCYFQDGFDKYLAVQIWSRYHRKKSTLNQGLVFKTQRTEKVTRLSGKKFIT